MTAKTLPLFLLSLAIISGCGGIMRPVGDPTPRTTPTPVPTSAVVWKFQDGFAHHMDIEVKPLPCAFGICDSNISLWHYTKDNCLAYWNPRTVAQCAMAVRLDELWFVLHRDPDGATRCIGFTYVDYLDIKWKVQILPVPGQPLPYTIIPASATASDMPTSYNAIVQESPAGDIATDFSVPPGTVNLNSTWQTFAGSETVASLLFGTVIALNSHQHENCIDESWDELNDELIAVLPIVGVQDSNPCAPMDPRLKMVRIG